MNKKKKTFKLDKYWKKNHDFDVEYEKLVYKYLCGTVSKWKIRKIKKGDKFTSYEDWKSYIREKYLNLLNLEDFYRYLNLNKRKKGNLKELNVILIIPIMAFLVGELIFDFSDLLNGFNLRKWIEDLLSGVANKLLNILVFILIFVAAFMLVAIFISFIMFIMYRPISQFYNADEEYYFFEDYMEIIKEIIDDRKNLEMTYNEKSNNSNM